MIVTVTLNPAIDRIAIVPDFKIGTVSPASYSREEAGGKGVNVSKTVHALGGETVATGFLAGSGGQLIRHRLNALGIPHDFVDVPGQTRTNLKIITPGKARTDINESGFSVSEDDFLRLRRRLAPYLKKGNTVIIGGSVPSGFSGIQYELLCRQVMEAGLPLILDGDAGHIQTARALSPALMKINLSDLNDLAQTLSPVPDSACLAASRIASPGRGALLVATAGLNAIYCADGEVWQIFAPETHIRWPIGTGDAAVGAAALALSEGADHPTAARFAVAASAASAAAEVPCLILRTEVVRLMERTVIKKVSF